MAKREMPIGSQPKGRVSARVKAAIDLIVHHGKKRDEAADQVHLHRDSLRKAFKRPDVLAYLRETLQALRTSAAAQTVFKAEALMHGAKSEFVQMDALKWLAGLEGVTPVQKSEVFHRHDGLMPGLTVIFAQPLPPALPEASTVDITPRRPLGLPERVPHPSELKRECDR